jgi:nicotinamidase-related amidase
MADATPVEPIADAVHLSIDMQNIFAPGGLWETPWMERALPSIEDITARHTTRTVFTRFITPLHAEDRPGRWRRYFGKWKCTTRAVLPSSEIELVPALRQFAPPARVIDKPAYSAFTGSALASFLSDKGIITLVITRSETDVCVLATVLHATMPGLTTLLLMPCVPRARQHFFFSQIQDFLC